MHNKKAYIFSLSLLLIFTGFLYNLSSEATKENPKLEPDQATDIDDPPWGKYFVYPAKVLSVAEIIEKGAEIPFDLIYDNPYWERQSYKSYWHSSASGGRWSYVPNRIHYAMHRLFTTYRTASVYYDFVHNLGIVNEWGNLEESRGGAYDNINVAVMNTKVEKILTYGNQVIIIGRPQRNGLTIIDVPVNKIKPFNEKEFILFQLVTELGDEIDYSLINYVVN